MVSYLDYQSIVSFYATNIGAIPLNIMRRYAFQSYTNEWEQRKNTYQFDENYIALNICALDGDGHSVHNIVTIEVEQDLINKYESSDLAVNTICHAFSRRLDNMDDDESEKYYGYKIK